ncbi:MAG: filamentous hemagglutinin N-terminal domain-containing protein, partial [Microcystaceae cyanobacterium]
MDIKLGLVGAALFFSVASGIAQAQITPDSTLPNNSQVSPRGNRTVIEGGTKAGSNLFHSFREFSVPTGAAAYFNNAADIANIFSRVTGGSVSTINGLIRANGAANLFLLNPNGILFGPNAVLDLGGSFLGSTADFIEFADGVRFSANAPSAPPLLTVSAPLGLVFGSNPDSISVQGSGHNFTGDDPTFSPLTRSVQFSGLAVRQGRTLALVGGDVSLQGGNLAAPG